MGLKLIRCPQCKRVHETDTGEVQAVLVCGQCGTVLQAPKSYTGPGSRPAADDKRIFGTEQERDDLREAGKGDREVEEAAAPVGGRLDESEEEHTRRELEEFIKRSEEADKREAAEGSKGFYDEDE